MPERHAEHDPAARRCAVLGSPITHSLSPAIHSAAYQYLGLDWQYTAHEVDEDGLAGFVAALDETWRGLSLTMPLKRAVFDVAGDVSELARTVGAANTLLRSDGGEMFADNTDVPGAVDALHERGVAAPSTACVWGGGATAASMLAALATMGAGPAHVHARSEQRARPALAVADAMGQPATTLPWQVAPPCGQAELTVNTAPAGALDPLAAELCTAAGPDRVLFDVLYDPWPTAVAAGWQERDGIVVGGLDLLIHQALGQLRLMTGHDVPVAVARRAAEDALAARVSS
ncbi:shikimate dehydrogenase [Actinobacteria bacterium YIM 96077]|uniref:Shikimate dehydrogenase n=1 Tax=Phytoactinopolyspora halophila TaxID=1981511 RepID=A0A329QEU9_9ACTN|nr:shikimate dehydrogenase [Phytoactinopolyspora halophila]AYY13446.1 shikimate dehydrogenase [Actinobacteria bacterium YIM 96077]RAW10840.1 shikimate dehydrogenase [Phytoactinopolyspora halophila]